MLRLAERRSRISKSSEVAGLGSADINLYATIYPRLEKPVHSATEINFSIPGKNHSEWPTCSTPDEHPRSADALLTGSPARVHLLVLMTAVGARLPIEARLQRPHGAKPAPTKSSEVNFQGDDQTEKIMLGEII